VSVSVSVSMSVPVSVSVSVFVCRCVSVCVCCVCVCVARCSDLVSKRNCRCAKKKNINLSEQKDLKQSDTFCQHLIAVFLFIKASRVSSRPHTLVA
jgi:hypothetical protein